jgi:hypothetical protein
MVLPEFCPTPGRPALLQYRAVLRARPTQAVAIAAVQYPRRDGDHLFMNFYHVGQP